MADAPTTPFDQLNDVLGHPLSLGLGTVCVAWLVGRVVHEQVRRLDLQPARPGARPFDWPALFSGLAFWLVMALGLYGVVARASYGSAVASMLEGAAGLALRLLTGAVVLAGAARLSATLAADAPDATAEDARRERRTITLAAAILAAAAVTGLAPGVALALTLAAVGVAVLLRSPDGRARIARWLSDLGAGLRLRELEPAARANAARGLQVPGAIGLLRTWVVEREQRRLVANEALLELLTTPPPAA
jgi:hypothetical protein